MSDRLYTYCAITSNTPIGKRYDADLNKTALPIAGGEVDVYQDDIEGIARHIESLGARGCLTAGVCRHDEAILTTKARETAGRTRNGRPVVARTTDNWHWPDEPGLIVFDHDPDHWTYSTLTSVEEVVKYVGDALGVDLTAFDYVARPSASSHIYLDGEEVVGFQGCHVYVGVKSLADIDADALLALAFDNELGCGVVSKSGAILKRTVFDSSLHKAPNMPVFCGDPTFEGAHESRRPVVVNLGAMLDLRAVQGALRSERAEASWHGIRAGLGGKAKVVFDAYVAEREASGISRSAVELAVAGELPGSWPILFDDGTQVLVRDIIQEPLTYNGRTDVRDPLEPEYGESKAKIYIDAGRATIHSMAHGGRTYRCDLDIESVGALLAGSEALKKDWPQLVVSLGSGYKASEIVEALHAGGAAGTKAELRERVKRLLRQTARARAKAGDWASRYLYLAESGRFVNLPTLEHRNRLSTVSTQSFNIINAANAGPSGEQPAAWLVSNGAIPVYETLIYTPPEKLGGALPCVEEAFNAWRPGPVVERVSAEPLEWLTLLKSLVPDEESRENFLDWMAYALQYPGRKCNWQVLLQGSEGIGKDTLLHPLRWGMGYHNTVDVTTSELLGSFQHYLVGGPKLVVLQELDAAHKTATANILKPLAAAPPLMHMVNQKNEKPVYVSNTQAVIVLTNAFHPFKLDAGDRRWYMLRCEEGKQSPELFKRLWAWYASGGVQVVAGYLAARDLSAFNPDVLPANTEYKNQVIDVSHTSYQMVVEDILAGKEVATPEWVAEQSHLGERVTTKQAMMVMYELGWVQAKASKKIDGRTASVRGWVSKTCRLAGNDLFDAIRFVKR